MKLLLLVEIAALVVAVVGLALWVGVGVALFFGGTAVVVACERNQKPSASGGDG